MKRFALALAAAVVAAALWWFLREPGGDPEGGGLVGELEAEGRIPRRGPDRRRGAASVPGWFGQANAPAATIAGVVLFRGSPVAGAQVELSSDLTLSGHAAPLQVRADGAGTFDFGPLPAARYVIAASGPGKPVTTVTLDTRDPTLDPPSSAIRIALGDCEIRLSGVVRDVSGGVVPGAELTHVGAGLLGTADDEGRYEVCSPRGGLAIEVSAAGYARERSQVTAYGPLSVDFELAPEAVFRGQVVRADTGAPLPDILVTAWPATLSRSLRELKAMSDADGMFQLDRLPPGRYQLQARGSGFSTREVAELVARVGDSGEPPVFHLEPARVVRGKVVREDGAPVAGIWLAASGAISVDAYSQADGSFVMLGVPAGDLRLIVPHQRVIEEDRQADSDGGEIQVTMTVAPMGSVSGRVLHDGAAVSGAWVSARDGERFAARSKTDADGRYELTGLEKGRYRVGADAPDRFTRGVLVDVEDGRATRGIELVLDLAASISGTLVDEGGAPIAGAYLQFSLIEGRDYGFATTDGEGRFEARAMAGGGRYAVEIRPSSSSPLTLRPPGGGEFPATRLKDGRSSVDGVRFVARYPRRSIAGRVVRAGEPVPDAAVEARVSGQRYSYELYDKQILTATNASGEFEIRDLTDERFDVTATAGGTESRLEAVPAGRRDLVIEMPAVVELAGEVAGFPGVPTVKACSLARPGAFSCVTAYSTRDRFSFADALMSERYLVVATSRHEAAAAKVDLAGGSRTDLSLRSGGRATLTGRVEDAGASERLRCSWTVDGDMSSSWLHGGEQVELDSAGRFTISVPADVPLRLYCRDDALWAQSPEPFSVPRGGSLAIDLETKKRRDGK